MVNIFFRLMLYILSVKTENNLTAYNNHDMIFLLHLDKPDTLICGNCKEMFRNIVDIINHKRHYCKLRFACKCSSSTANLALLKEGKLMNDKEEIHKSKSGNIFLFDLICNLKWL